MTDGTANASLPKGMEPDELTMEEAVPMLLAAAKRKKAKSKSKAKPKSIAKPKSKAKK